MTSHGLSALLHSMHVTMIDVTHVPGAQGGDLVLLHGCCDGDSLTLTVSCVVSLTLFASRQAWLLLQPQAGALGDHDHDASSDTL